MFKSRKTDRIDDLSKDPWLMSSSHGMNTGLEPLRGAGEEEPETILGFRLETVYLPAASGASPLASVVQLNF